MAKPSDYGQIRTASKKDTSPALAQNIVEIANDPAISTLRLHYKGTLVTRDLLLKVAGLIGKGTVMTVVDRQKVKLTEPYEAAYVEAYDILITNFEDTTDLYPKSVLIHELVHMISDLKGTPLPEMNSEMTAYVFQAMYCRKKGKRDDNFSGATDRRLFPAAFVLADSFLSRHLPSPAQEDALANAIRARRVYQGIDDRTRAFDKIVGAGKR